MWALRLREPLNSVCLWFKVNISTSQSSCLCIIILSLMKNKRAKVSQSPASVAKIHSGNQPVADERPWVIFFPFLLGAAGMQPWKYLKLNRAAKHRLRCLYSNSTNPAATQPELGPSFQNEVRLLLTEITITCQHVIFDVRFFRNG